MARQRTLKPDFFSDKILGSLPLGARLTFAALWVLADREGRLKDSPKTISGFAFPEDEDIDRATVDIWLTKLHNGGFIIRYALGDEKYIEITNWHKHQSPHFKEVQSVIPPPKPRKKGHSMTAKSSAEPSKSQCSAGEKSVLSRPDTDTDTNTEPPCPPIRENQDQEPRLKSEKTRKSEEPIQLTGKDGRLSPPVGTKEFVEWYVQEKTEHDDPERVQRFRSQIAKHYREVQKIGAAYGFCGPALGQKLQEMQVWILGEPKKGDKANFIRFIRNWLKRENRSTGNSVSGGLSYDEEQEHYENHRRSGTNTGPTSIGQILARFGSAGEQPHDQAAAPEVKP